MYEHVLLPLDGSNLAERAIPHAEVLARSCGAKVSIVHVLDSRKYLQLMLAGRRPPDYLNRVADRLKKNGILKTEIKALTGDPAKAIITYSEANACDIIVMTGRTRYGVIGRLCGVAARVFRASKVPVLSVRVTDEF
jgi:nucleotide-binding universal stress UspA family protein